MTIVYFTIRNNSRRDGVIKKIERQVGFWRSLGHTVQVISIACRGEDSLLDGDLFHWFQKIPKIRSTIPVLAALRRVKEINPDIVYMRYFVWNITSYLVLRKYPTIMEINSDDRAELRLAWRNHKNSRKFLLMVINRFFRRSVLREVKGFCLVTNELDKSLPRRTDKLVLPNTIDIKNYSRITHRESGRLGFFFMGTPGQPWHGIDRIVKIVEMLGEEYTLDVVGLVGENTSQVTYHGYLDAEQYLQILRECHICVATMAIERNQMTQACPLKTREYLALGYPVIIGYTDSEPAIMKSEYVLKINWTNLDVEAIKDFCRLNQNTIIEDSELLKSIDFNASEARRLEFFEALSRGSE